MTIVNDANSWKVRSLILKRGQNEDDLISGDLSSLKEENDLN